MELFVNIVIDGKPLNIFVKSSILDLWDWRSEYDSGISKVTCNLKVKFTFYAKVQGKVNTYAKMKKSKHCKKDNDILQEHMKIVWLKRWDNCYEMFQKIAVLKFLGKHAWWRPLLPRCAAYSLERYWRPIPSQTFSCELFEISDNSNLTRWTTVISHLLSYHVHCTPIPHQYK